MAKLFFRFLFLGFFLNGCTGKYFEKNMAPLQKINNVNEIVGCYNDVSIAHTWTFKSKLLGRKQTDKMKDVKYFCIKASQNDVDITWYNEKNNPIKRKKFKNIYMDNGKLILSVKKAITGESSLGYGSSKLMLRAGLTKKKNLYLEDESFTVGYLVVVPIVGGSTHVSEYKRIKLDEI